MTYRQCPSCGGECKKSGCERADVIETYPENFIDALRFDTALNNKEWVGLTDDERIEISWGTDTNLQYAIAIEAKLKEKNAA